MCSVHKIGYVYQNSNRKVVHRYLILGLLKLKALRSIAANMVLLLMPLQDYYDLVIAPWLKRATFYSILSTLCLSLIKNLRTKEARSLPLSKEFHFLWGDSTLYQSLIENSCMKDARSLPFRHRICLFTVF